jgi:hypothetical protein
MSAKVVKKEEEVEEEQKEEGEEDEEDPQAGFTEMKPDSRRLCT